ncbi:hypothetical protein TSOC_013495 [Tetrabaena socialis]|uniref:Uncharacterized protein n=1 Tax=Tetrabaena socialis TaxID=47790 RepID=A0A2J7ZK81_9CHLO|nr:hypothetical protein TSOC_013495 [Tetrabaena socialis]|eukprot:PNH00671.1 hypothetical protein TSOC_013495 [Tetrabaena socialis]
MVLSLALTAAKNGALPPAMLQVVSPFRARMEQLGQLGKGGFRSVVAVRRFFAFCAAASMDPSVVGLKPDAVLRPYDTVPGGTPSGELPPQAAAGTYLNRSTCATFRFDEVSGTGGPATPESSLRGSDYEAFARMAGAFNTSFFTDPAAAATSKAAAAGLKQYLLPPTFYMSERFDAVVDETHARVCEALQQLYDAHKAEYGWADRPLVIN